VIVVDKLVSKAFIGTCRCVLLASVVLLNFIELTCADMCLPAANNNY